MGKVNHANIWEGTRKTIRKRWNKSQKTLRGRGWQVWKQQESHYCYRGKGRDEETEINTQCIPQQNPIQTLGFILNMRRKHWVLKRLAGQQEKYQQSNRHRGRQTSKEPTAVVPEGKNSDLMRVVLVMPFWYWES